MSGSEADAGARAEVKPGSRRLRVAGALSPYLDRTSRRMVVRLGVLSGIGGTLEAAALAAMSSAAIAATRGDKSLRILRVEWSFGAAVLVALALLMGRMVFAWFGSKLNARLVDRVYRATVSRLMRGYLHAEWAIVADQRLGDLQTMILSNAYRVSSVTLTLGQAITNVLSVAAMIAISAALNPLTIAVLVVAGLILFGVFRPVIRLSRRYARELATHSRVFASRVTEVSRVAAEVRTLNVTDAVSAEIVASVDGMGAISRRSRFISLLVPTIYQTTIFALALGFAVLLSRVSLSRTSAVAGTVLLLLRSLTYLNALQNNYNHLIENEAFLDDLTVEISRFEARPEVGGSQPLTKVSSLRFAEASFAYDERFELRQIDVDVPLGSSLGIVGPSGGGKSTLLQLLLGLRVPTSGEVLVNGLPLHSFSLSDVRRIVTFVPQAPALIAGTIADNVRFWRDVSDEAVLAACRRAHLGDDLDRWPAGLLTEVGEGGGALSGGQRQRVSIARALVTDPDVLVLDEPTSALDAKSEFAIHEMLEELKGKVTVVVVAHRPGTIKACDQLLVVNDGRMEAIGPVAELARSNEFVRSMMAALPG